MGIRALGQIGDGYANPWIPTVSSGHVTRKMVETRYDKLGSGTLAEGAMLVGASYVAGRTGIRYGTGFAKVPELPLESIDIEG